MWLVVFLEVDTHMLPKRTLMKGLPFTAFLMLASVGFAKSPASSNIAHLPIAFEPNQGQAETGALFTGRGDGYAVALDKTGSKLMLRAGDKKAAIRTDLTGANPRATLSGLDLQKSYSSYFRGKDSSKWAVNVPNYGQVKESSVYPGIDLLYYGNQSKLEYDFVVAPGADPRAIRMRFSGVTSVKTDAEGNLVLSTASGNVVQHKPVIYQEIAGIRREVEGAFAVHANREVTFRIGAYDRSAALTIDPYVVYASFLGGFSTDEGHAVTADTQGNMYLVGVTYSTQAGDADVMLRKIAPDGSGFVWNADLGGSDDDFGNGIAVDANGFVYVGGDTFSTDFPTAAPWQANNAGDRNAFVLKIDPAATTLMYSTYFGGSVDDFGYAVALDRNGNLYLTGSTDSPDMPASQTAYQQSLLGNSDAYVAKFDSNGNAIFNTFIGKGSHNEAWSIAADSNGNTYITGDTDSDSFPQINPPFQHSRHGGLDAFLTIVSNDGTQLFLSTFIGGSNDDSGTGIALDPSGNIYIAGTTASSDFPTTNGYNSSYNGGSTDIFVVKYSPGGGSLLFSTFVGSHGTDEANAIAVDANGTVYVAGDTNSDQYPVTSDAVQGSRRGGFDAVLSVLDTNGTRLLYSTYFGGSGDDSAMGVAVDPFYNVYVTGVTSSGDFPVTQVAVQPQPGGGDSDAFLTKINLQHSSIPGSDVPPVSQISSDAMPAVLASPQSAFHRGMIAPSRAKKSTFGAHTDAVAHHGARPKFGNEAGQGRVKETR